MDNIAAGSVALETGPYGSWRSPITSDLIVAAAIGLGEILTDGDDVYWLESRPEEAGRSVVVVCSAGAGAPRDITPGIPADRTPAFNVRTRVHEYGGGAYLVSNGTVFFSNDADRFLYRQSPGSAPVPIAQGEKLRYADGVFDVQRNRMIWVRQDHTKSELQPTNTLVAIDPAGTVPQQVLVQGDDFYSSPRLTRDGTRLAWLQWHHPNMPWNGTELWVGKLAKDGSVGSKSKVAGGDDESIVQPEWSPEGTLYFVSDRTGWWNLYRVDGDPLAVDQANIKTQAVVPMNAEFGHPQWNFRMSTYGFESERRLICSCIRNGKAELLVLDTSTLKVDPIQTAYTDISSVHAADGAVYIRGGSPTRFSAVVKIDLATCTETVLKNSSKWSADAYLDYISAAQSVAFDTANNQKAYGLYYAPVNRKYTTPTDELPPLIIHCHGGPTAAASSTLDWRIQYWTSRGFALLDVDYGGSSGYGRAYRQRLNGQWGIVDVDDCVNGAKFLVEQKLADGKRMAISGGSAGGYTTLACLTFRQVFKTGASYYGISDLERLATDTHKFESHYLEGLIGPYPKCKDLYVQRSPVHFADRLSVPVSFFQGNEDPIVPPSQADLMMAALKAKGVPVQYLLFDGEQHGFRQSRNIKRSLDAELYFFSVFLAGQKLTFQVE